MSSLTFKQDTYILNNVKNILKIPHQDSNAGGEGGRGECGELMFYEMDGSFHRDAFGSQAGRMEHPRGSGAESLMPSDRAGARGGPGVLRARGARLGAQSARLVSIQPVIPF